MKRVTIRRSKFCPYTEDFVEGFNSGAEKQYEADRKVLEEIREEAKEYTFTHTIRKEGWWKGSDQRKKDFTKMTLKEIAEEISNATGYEFKEDTSNTWRRGGWYFKKSGVTCEVHLGTYYEDCIPSTNHTKDGSYIGVGISFNLGGSSMPADSLDEAIRFFKKNIPVYLEWAKRR